jgi:beta-N-acetylhexosaminidase
MTPKFDLGKKFLVEPHGPVLTDTEKELLSELRPAALMFRKRNFLQDVGYSEWVECFAKLVSDCRAAIGRERLILSVDHEGGRVIRFPEPITRFPYAANWPHTAEEVAQAMAVELKSLGINVNFAPVADINSNPANPVIADRAFARSPHEVAQAATAFAGALMRNGIYPCAKHFPGHGDTTVDSHFGLPVVNLTLGELRQRELIPFKALIEARVPLVMTAHILFPEIDPDNCATLSEPILDGILRKELSFSGVIIADALGMAPTSKSIDQQGTVTKSINAGLDIFLLAGDNIRLEQALTIKRHIEDALLNGSITEQSLQSSIERIDGLLKNMPQYEILELDQDVLARHHALAKMLSAPQHRTFELNLPGFE